MPLRFPSHCPCLCCKFALFFLLSPRIIRTPAMKCPSCCLDCSSKNVISEPIIPSALALCNLLPAGVVRLSVFPGHCSCKHKYTEDGWHILDSQYLLSRAFSAEDDSLLRALDFLIKHSFVLCTCRLNDLANVCKNAPGAHNIIHSSRTLGCICQSLHPL